MDTHQNFAQAEMLIRNPIEEVFEAFINPNVTTRFWFTDGSGRLDENLHVEWKWAMYDLTIPVKVKVVERPNRIVIEWGGQDDTSTVEWKFRTIEGKGTFVTIINSGFRGDPDEIIANVRNSTEGFAFVLAGAKALLEYGVRLELIADRFPEGIK
jgi:uncharacterized protein YndB with AHSA1/START domain